MVFSQHECEVGIVEIVIFIAIIVVFLVVKKMGQIDPGLAKALLKNGAVLVDVRTAGEFAGGSVKNALNIPLDQLSETAEKILPDKEKPVLVFCLSGTRSAMARKLLLSAGYKQVFNLGSFARAKGIAE